MNSFIKYANTVQEYTNVNLAAIPGSPLDKATKSISPGEELEEGIVITEGLEDAISESLDLPLTGYGAVCEDIVNELVAISSKRLVFLQSVVAPLAASFSGAVNLKIDNELSTASILDYDVLMHDLPKLAHDHRLASLLESYLEGRPAIVTCMPIYDLLLDDTDQSYTESLVSGMEDWDKLVSELITENGETEYTKLAIDRTLRNSRNVESRDGKELISYLPNPEKLRDYLTCFLVLNSMTVGGYERYEELNRVRYPKVTLIRDTQAALATAIKTIVAAYEKEISEGKLIRSFDSENRVVTVNKESFDDYISHDGEVEAIKMSAILSLDKRVNLKETTVSQLLENKDYLLDLFNKHLAAIEAAELARVAENIYAGVIPSLSEILESKSALELGFNDLNLTKVISTASTILSQYKVQDLMDRPVGICNKVLIDALWPRSSFLGFINRMNDEARKNPSLDARQAAYHAFVAEIVSTLLKQTKQVV